MLRIKRVANQQRIIGIEGLACLNRLIPKRLNMDLVSFSTTAYLGPHENPAAIWIRHDCQAFNPGFRYRLQPHRLPDTGRRRVVNTLRLGDLLTARLGAMVRSVPHAHDQLLLLASFEGIRDVEAEGVIAAAMLAEFRAVQPHGRFPIDCTEVKQDTLAVPLLRHSEAAAIPQPLSALHD